MLVIYDFHSEWRIWHDLAIWHFWHFWHSCRIIGSDYSARHGDKPTVGQPNNGSWQTSRVRDEWMQGVQPRRWRNRCGIADMYQLNQPSGVCMVAQTSSDANIWHRRLGHINAGDLCKMKNGIVNGIQFADSVESIKNCVVCCKGKQSRKPFKSLSLSLSSFNTFDLKFFFFLQY